MTDADRKQLGLDLEPKVKPPTRRFSIPVGTPRRSCTSCSAVIFWVVTSNNRKMPVDPDGTSHFATCPHAAKHRR